MDFYCLNRAILWGKEEAASIEERLREKNGNCKLRKSLEVQRHGEGSSEDIGLLCPAAAASA